MKEAYEDSVMNYDDWKAETQDRLPKSSIYRVLKNKCDSDPAGNHVLSLVDDATFFAYQNTKTILMHMGEFTLHDGDHLFRVLMLMEKLLSPKKIEELSIPELMLLVLSAFFHDIGMAADEKDVCAWKKVWDTSPSLSAEDEIEYNKFCRFYLSKPDLNAQLESYISQGKNSDAGLLKYYIVSDYIRVTHASRARDIIESDWLGKIKYRDVDLTVEFAEICSSHNDDALSLLQLDRNYLCADGIHANFQLVAVILRLADILDFDAKRTPSVLFSHLFVRHPISIKEWNKHRAIESWSISKEKIQFHAKCEHPAIEASIHDFCDVIDAELSACNNIISSINDYDRAQGKEHLIEIPFNVDRSKIETKKTISGEPLYLYQKAQFNLSKNQVIDLLMGTKLYGDPEVALRELLQNSIDACLLRSAMEKSWGNLYEPEVHIKYSTENEGDVLEIIDNGTGMDQYIIDTYYSKVGSSFYKSPDFFDLKSQSKAEFNPTSRFGIGILSCFMVADTLVVDTRRVYGPHDSSEPINLTIEGQDSIFWVKPGERKKPGTSTKLFLRKNVNPWDDLSEDDFIQSVENVIPNPPFKIRVETKSHEKVRDENSFEEIKADSLKNYSWDKHVNIREFKIELEDETKGFKGSVVVAILESNNVPVSSIEMTSRSIDIEGESFPLEKSLRMSSNEICESTTSITIDENGSIDQSDSQNDLCKSKSRLSLHGIEVPTSLFPEFWRMQKNQVKLDWPFPMVIVVDICGNMDLDLNSARTQIIMSEKWQNFEGMLALEICSSISNSVSDKYWHKLVEILKENTKNEIFRESLEQANKNRG
ncbi:MAG: ATP-binding protein [Candidatus Thiodiazotropha endolucinida]|uniref:Chaperone protein HtpG n=1 Tax=Candidatus Thiodiazotropha endolucinida TaxID=1655433 RepID=A0A7Z0VJD4_9GAMM|nr:HD domain-containing protein [Candidatus Thiodiazotropha endolucinida]ODJ86722.1 chaperone protein HtpG [Candidatus Thiodiazotropha endolucinida]